MVIILAIYSVILKTIQKCQKQVEEFEVFHLILWELKGQLSNKQTMNSLLRKYFDEEDYRKFIKSSREDLMVRYLKSPTNNTFNEQLTFRSSVDQNEKYIKSALLCQSFKDVSLLCKTINKENSN
jgi:hypothetical protein